jgi:hypothetical protein
VHDRRKLADILDAANPALDGWAKRTKGFVKRSLVERRAEGDSAYRSQV